MTQITSLFVVATIFLLANKSGLNMSCGESVRVVSIMNCFLLFTVVALALVPSLEMLMLWDRGHIL